MRRAQSVRHYARPSLALAADDLGVLREGDESNEDVLRRQLVDRDREVDRLRLTIQAHQDQLQQRPPIEQVNALQQEFKNLELILKGTQRENEKVMSEKEQLKMYIKTLERELTRLAGDHWQENLNIEPNPSTLGNPLRSGINLTHQRSHTISSSPMSSYPPVLGRHTHSPSPSPSTSRFDQRMSRSPTPSHNSQTQNQDKDAEAAERERQRLAQLEQLRLLILGMEQRLEVREEKLVKTVERAENEGKKYEAAAAAVAASGLKFQAA